MNGVGLTYIVRCQEERELAASLISDVYALAEHCGHGDLCDELIQDRLVVGIRNSRLSERLQLDADLTLDKAVTIIQQSETVHRHQVFLHGGNRCFFAETTMKQDNFQLMR